MFHKGRTHRVAPVASAEELAEKLTQHTWTLCTGFRLGDYVYLNDSTSEDGAAEFAVLKLPAPHPDRGTAPQVETITFGWCERAEALEYVQKVQAGGYDAQAWVSGYKVDQNPAHECARCA